MENPNASSASLPLYATENNASSRSPNSTTAKHVNQAPNQASRGSPPRELLQIRSRSDSQNESPLLICHYRKFLLAILPVHAAVEEQL